MPSETYMDALLSGALSRREPRDIYGRTIKKEEEMPPLTAREGFTFGCDPEVFVFDAKGRPVPADMIPGSKESPHKVEGGAVQRDGMAAEINIDPAASFEEFDTRIKAVLKQLEDFLPKGHTFKAVPSVVFDPSVFDKAPDDAKELGCSPDFNAWTGEINPPPGNPDNPYMRCAGGHVHYGWTSGADLTDPQHVMNCRDLVKQLDWFLGGWSVRRDTDPTRRSLYGRAGACRLKDYGVEYRVLSNFWITTRDRRLAVWNRSVTAIETMSSRFIPDKAGGHNALLIESINATKANSSLESFYRYPLRAIA